MVTTSDAILAEKMARWSTDVECYSGHTYAQEPRAFRLGAQRRNVIVVNRRWREPTGPCFEVLADDGYTYVLAYREMTDCWSVSAKADCRRSA